MNFTLKFFTNNVCKEVNKRIFIDIVYNEIKTLNNENLVINVR